MAEPSDFDELFAESRNSISYHTEWAMIDFTEDVVSRMIEQSMTRTELAARLGVSKAYVTKMLSGNNNFTLETMVRVSQALGGKLRIGIDDEVTQAEPAAIVGQEDAEPQSDAVAPPPAAGRPKRRAAAKKTPSAKTEG